jgi:hypothetical protein
MARHLALRVVLLWVLPPDQRLIPHLAQHLDRHQGLIVVLREVLPPEQAP